MLEFGGACPKKAVGEKLRASRMKTIPHDRIRDTLRNEEATVSTKIMLLDSALFHVLTCLSYHRMKGSSAHVEIV